jgi:hypothetical protein
LPKLVNLRGVSHRWQEPAKHGNLTGEQMGFVTQEVEVVFGAHPMYQGAITMRTQLEQRLQELHSESVWKQNLYKTRP